MSRSHMGLSDVLSTSGWIFEESHLAFLTIQSQETVRNRRDRTDRRTGIFLEACVQAGKEAWLAFWELHGLYCLLSALLNRLEICSSAVQDYASFICFLPVHQAALLESWCMLNDAIPFRFPQGFSENPVFGWSFSVGFRFGRGQRPTPSTPASTNR